MALADHALRLDATYPAQPLQVPAIRRAVNDVAVRCGAESEILMRLDLVVSEAATNVVLHAYRTPGSHGDIHVTASANGADFDVRIRDDGVGMAPRPDSPGMGLGLSLMASESDRFEIRCTEGGGTEVVLRFGLGARAAPRRPFMRDDASSAAATA
jgi:anti-sigma regulatory factor (Ser/Thr protein kinase)